MVFAPHQKVSSARSQQSSRAKMGSSSSSERSFGSSSRSCSSFDSCSCAFSNSSDTRGAGGSSYHNPNPTQPEAVPGVDEEIVLESVVYLEGVHRFVDHKTCSGRIIRTEKDGFGRVHWHHEPWMLRANVAGRRRSAYYWFGQGPTIRALKKASEFYNGHYNLLSNNCGTHAEAQVSGWGGKQVWHWQSNSWLICELLADQSPPNHNDGLCGFVLRWGLLWPLLKSLQKSPGPSMAPVWRWVFVESRRSCKKMSAAPPFAVKEAKGQW